MSRVVAESVDQSTAQRPLRHAAMEAIRLAAERDLHTWPDDVPPQEKRPRLDAQAPDETKPYLCSGYEIYCLKEPCIMCAMAMVHSRFAVVVFTTKDTRDGAFTVHRLHGEKQLNHRYRVYRLDTAE